MQHSTAQAVLDTFVNTLELVEMQDVRQTESVPKVEITGDSMRKWISWGTEDGEAFSKQAQIDQLIGVVMALAQKNAELESEVSVLSNAVATLQNK